jgi:hypothetical protein
LTNITLRAKKCRKPESDVLIGIRLLFVRQLDVQADARGLARKRALVRGLHDAGPAAADHGKAGIGQLPRDLLGQQVVRVVRGDPCGTEHAHRGLDSRQAFKALDEFGHDLEDLPAFAGEFGVVDGGEPGMMGSRSRPSFGLGPCSLLIRIA